MYYDVKTLVDVKPC